MRYRSAVNTVEGDIGRFAAATEEVDEHVHRSQALGGCER
jgi:hypothetical protein